MTSQPEKKTIAMHKLANISRNKNKQTIKFDQVNMRKTFVKRPYTK